MTSVLASATILSAQGRRDVAIPMGTTVAGLLAMMRIDSARPGIAITLADGQPAALNAAVGKDLPSGVVIAISDADQGTDKLALHPAHHPQRRWVDVAIVAVTTLAVVATWEAGVFVHPALTHQPLGLGVRIASAIACIAVIASLLRWPRISDSPWGAVLMPPLLGIAVGGAIPIGDNFGMGGNIILTACATSLCAVVVWMLRAGPAAATAAAAWTATGALAACAVAFHWDPPALALAASGVIVVALSALPDHALRLPDTDLLNLPFLARQETALRQPEVLEPAPISGRGVHDALLRAETILETGIWWGVFAIVALLPLSVQMLGTGTWVEWTALTAFGFIVTALALLPQRHPSPHVQCVPRLGSALVAIFALVALLMPLSFGVVAVAAALIFAAFGLTLAVVVTVKREESAAVAHAGDVARRVSLAFVLPCSLVGANIIETVWRATS